MLVVDASYGEGRDLAHTLRMHGIHAFAARNFEHARSILGFRAFDILLVEVDEPGICRGSALIRWARNVCPRPRIVIMCDQSVLNQGRQVGPPGIGFVLAKPVNVQELLSFLGSTHTRSSFSGTVDYVDLVDYLQFIMLTGKKTILEVVSNLGTTGRLFISEGNVVHAQCGILAGEKALYRCLCFREGTFGHFPWAEPEQVTINKPGEFVLMEAVHQRDEVWARSDEPDNK